MTDFPSPLSESASQGAARGFDEFLEAVRLHGSDHDEAGVRPVGGAVKRVADLLIAIVALVTLTPLMLMIALLILVTMGRPVFYAHERIGFRHRRFGCLKFRSMINNPDAALRRHFDADPEAEREWNETRKLRDDPRITFVGRALRKSSMDELPQLLNVLRGEMSCVGPRPVTAEELDRYGARAPRYLSARPGMTGLWQVSGRSSVGYDRRVALDEDYVRGWSLRRDLKILLRTVVVVARLDDAA